jgi:hypothetical protein
MKRILLDTLSQVKNVKNNKPLRETVRYFEEHTSAQLEKLAPPKENGAAGKPHYYKKSTVAKVSEVESIRKFNDLSRVSDFRSTVRAG